MYSLIDTSGMGGFESVSRNSRTRKSCLDKMLKFMRANGDLEKGWGKETLNNKQEFIENCEYKLIRHKHKIKED